jgi:hypothetical protein
MKSMVYAMSLFSGRKRTLSQNIGSSDELEGRTIVGTSKSSDNSDETYVN